jgi:general secretion pathway protein A
MMFTNHFKMSAQPFLERTPVERLQKDERIQQGLARLDYLTQSGSVALITGQTGVGKSSLIKLFVHSLSRNRYLPLYIHLTHGVQASGILRLIVQSLGEVPKRGKERLFLQILEKTHATEPTTLLLIDEAHLLKPESLTDLRLLVSSALGDDAPMKIVFSGQGPLRDELKRVRHADLVQRIDVRYSMRPLSKDETVAYIDFQMQSVGASDKVFESEAKSLIHDYANGVPRQINNIATACLINAATKGLQKINESLVNETMGEFHLP